MTILNRPGLEEASCECYEASAAHFARLRDPDVTGMCMPRDREPPSRITASINISEH